MSEKWPIGVFASIDAGLGVKLEVARDLGVRTIHLHTPHASSRTPQRASEFNNRLADFRITITCVFAGFEGESYADIPTVKRTVGLMPRETRAARTAELKSIADFARELKVDVVGIHLGFVPHEKSDPEYREMLDITRDVCDHCKGNGQALHLETGQEPVDVLIEFLDDVDRDNLFVNFDPANMILYGTGEPIEALKKVGKYVRSVHCKDGTWSDQPGETWIARPQHPLQRRHLV
jgi:sugar phosphate isomerase/epimerase